MEFHQPLPGLICHSVGWAQSRLLPPRAHPPTFSPLFLIYTPLRCCHAPLRFKGVTCDVMASGRAAECGGGHIYLSISVCEGLRWEPGRFCMRVLPAERCQADHTWILTLAAAAAAARSRWGHCTAPCINNSQGAGESGGVCLPAQ